MAACLYFLSMSAVYVSKMSDVMSRKCQSLSRRGVVLTCGPSGRCSTGGQQFRW